MAGGDAIVVSGRSVSGLTTSAVHLQLPGQIILFLGTLGLVFFVSWRIDRLNVSTATTLFMSTPRCLRHAVVIFVAYTQTSITRSSSSRRRCSVVEPVGYTTKRDLSGFGLLMMV